MKKIFFILLVSALSTTLNVVAQSDTLSVECAEELVTEATNPDELWALANNAYINGNFSKAIKFYEAIEAQGLQSLPLYYNLANGYFKLGDVAKSLLYYYRALKIEPSDEDTKHNIEVVEAQTKDKIEAIPLFILAEWSKAVSNLLPIVWWSIISVVAWCGVLAFLIMFLLSRQLSLRKFGFYGVVIFVILMFVSTSYAVSESREIVDNNDAIVMSQSLAVKSSPSSASTDLFIIHAGTKVEVVTTLEGWSKVIIADGRQGWVESKRLEII